MNKQQWQKIKDFGEKTKWSGIFLAFTGVLLYFIGSGTVAVAEKQIMILDKAKLDQAVLK